MKKNIDPLEEERGDALRAVWSFVFVLAILAVSAGVSAYLIVNRVQPRQKETERPVPTVDTVALVPGTHTVNLTSEGVVQSRREVSLAAEVSGRVVSISEQLIEGGRVAAGDVLATIDDADHQVALRQAKTAVAEAELSIEQEKARGIQAQRDWEKLGRGEAPDLVLRKPQIVAAEARLASAHAEVERALRDIRRTSITAPFSGRIRKAFIEEGAFVAPGSPVADMFSDEEVEVRLPFPLADYAQLLGEKTPPFSVTAEIAGKKAEWQAVLERMEGEIDRATLSGYAIARIQADEHGKYPPVGLFVRAELAGKTIGNVVEIPRSALRGAHDVWVLEGGRLAKRRVDVVRAARESLVVTGDFKSGDRLVTTRLAAPVPGMELKARQQDPQSPMNHEPQMNADGHRQE
jgi:RND family efflux transporter MFP subunit